MLTRSARAVQRTMVRADPPFPPRSRPASHPDVRSARCGPKSVSGDTVEARIARIIRALHTEKRTIVLVEQNARLALALAQKGYVMETGRIVLEGPASDLRDNDKVQHTYLGVA